MFVDEIKSDQQLSVYRLDGPLLVDAVEAVEGDLAAVQFVEVDLLARFCSLDELGS